MLEDSTTSDSATETSLAVEATPPDGSEETTPIVASEETPPDTSLEETAETPPTGEGEKIDPEGEETGEVATGEGEEPGEVTEAEEVTPVVFDEADDLPGTLVKANTVFEKYEIPDEVLAAFEAVKTRAEANTIEAFSDYGDMETVKQILEQNGNLISARIVNENGVEKRRPNTDIYAQNLFETAPEKVDWLAGDLLSLPSRKYQGLNKRQEINADMFGMEGESVGSFLKRAADWENYLQTNAIVPDSEIPEFIPTSVHQAFKELDKEAREACWLLDPVYDEDDIRNQFKRENKLVELAKIQKGIDADLKTQVEEKEAQRQEAQALVDKTVKAQTTFYTTAKNDFFERLKKEVVFSTNPAQQILAAGQTVTTIENAFLADGSGEFARSVLTESGVKFDFEKARSLVAGVEQASIALTEADRHKTSDGKPLNPLELNRAVRLFGEKTMEWTDFADEVIKQLSAVTSNGNKDALETAIKKQKIELKSRPAVKSTASQVSAREKVPGIYDANYAEYWVEKNLQDEMNKAKAYSG